MDETIRVIAAGSAAGGTGQTSFAVNIAVELAKSGKKTVLVDADAAFGDGALFLHLQPHLTLKEAAERQDSSRIADYCLKHESGLFLLAAPVRPEFAELITADFFADAIDSLRQTFDVIVIDAGTGLHALSLPSFELADQIYAVTAPGLARMKNTKLFVDTMEALELKEKLALVSVEQKRKAFVKPAEAAVICAAERLVVLPNAADELAESMETGVPVVVSHPRGAYAGAIRSEIRHLFEPKPALPEKLRKWTKWKEMKRHEPARKAAVKESDI
ncbi:CpaE family protein [Bacillus daqingensis]|uniref:CpaE family protein n=1 Tax=Bacillus daqingensis TaxID=872396 RepID=A0ABV9NY92_9BACI